MEIADLIKKEMINEKNDIIKNKINSKQHRQLIQKILSEKDYNDEYFSYIINGYNDFTENKFLMKNNKIYFEDFFKQDDVNEHGYLKSFENFNDTVQKSILRNKAKKLEKRILSKKYEHLCDEETHDIFLTMAEFEFTTDELQKFIGRKIGAFHYPVEFNGALLNLIDTKAGWDFDKTMKRLNDKGFIEGKDYTIDYNKDEKLVLGVNSFEAMSVIGSKMWCISREKAMFRHYKKERCTDYKLIFDFNKSPSDDFSFIASLNSPDNQIRSIYTKGDEEFKPIQNQYDENYETVKNIMIEAYKDSDISMTNLVKKIIEEPYLESSYLSEKGYFDINDTEDLNIFFENTSCVNGVITKEDFINNKELFGLEETPEEDINHFDLLKDEGFLKQLSWSLKERNVSEKIFKHKSMTDKDWDSLINNDKLISSISKNFEAISEVLLFDKNYSNIIKLLKTEKVQEHITEKKNYQISGVNETLFYKLISNKGFCDYCVEHKDDTLEKIINKNDTDEILLTVLFNAKRTDELERLKGLIHSDSNKVFEMSDFGRQKEYYSELLIQGLAGKEKAFVEHFDFNGYEEEIIKKSFFTQLNTPNRNFMFTDEELIRRQNVKMEVNRKLIDIVAKKEPSPVEKLMGVDNQFFFYYGEGSVTKLIENASVYDLSDKTKDTSAKFYLVIDIAKKLIEHGKMKKIDIYDHLQFNFIKDGSEHMVEDFKEYMKIIRENSDLFSCKTLDHKIDELNAPDTVKRIVKESLIEENKNSLQEINKKTNKKTFKR